MTDESTGFRARPVSSNAVPPKLDTVAIIVNDLTELAADARVIVSKGPDHFLGDEGRSDRHAADGIMIKVQELCERLPQQFKADHPSVPWNEIRGIRNLIGHNYRATDQQIVWVTLTDDLPALVDAVT